MAQNNEPNQYQLLGTGVSITYSTSSIAGQPQLSFKKGRQTLSFSGDQIDVTETSVGTLVTVVIGSKPDLETTRFSFLLPAIRLATTKQAFRTIGLTTVTKTTIAGPPKGVQQTYKTIALRGSAQQVAFLTKKTTAH
jgi:hypothetical protein